MRQAVAYALNQKDMLASVIGDPEWFRECKSLFPCGSPLESTKGFDDKLDSNFAKARALLQEAGYDGTPIVLMQSTDLVALSNLAPVSKSLLEKAGFKVDVQAMDWQTLVTRRTKKDPPAAGGWSLAADGSSEVEQVKPVVDLVRPIPLTGQGRGEQPPAPSDIVSNTVRRTRHGSQKIRPDVHSRVEGDIEMSLPQHTDKS